jgi:DNA-binding NarL/FixJ family response regulator
MRLVVLGQTNREIAQRLGVAEGTLRAYMSHIFAKLQARNCAETTCMAWKFSGI